MESISSPIASRAGVKAAAQESLEQAIEVFDELFLQIAPINLYNDPSFGHDLKICRRSLTDRQCHAIKALSGHLISARNHLKQQQDSAAFAPNSTGGNSNATTLESDASLAKKMILLQEYLVNELNRSEHAEQRLKVKEDELVAVTAEKEKLLKKIAAMTAGGIYVQSNAGGSSYSTSSVKAGSATVKTEYQPSDRGDPNPHNYVGCYIRKAFGNSYFFGVIAAYDQPEQYFQVRPIICHTFSCPIVTHNSVHLICVDCLRRRRL